MTATQLLRTLLLTAALLTAHGSADGQQSLYYKMLDTNDGVALTRPTDGSYYSGDIVVHSLVYMPGKGYKRVKAIAANAFAGCNRLTSVTLPDGLISIGRDAFNGCDSLTSLTIPGSVTTIEPNAFAKSGIKSMTFEDGEEFLMSAMLPTSIERLRFGRNADHLSTVDLPNLTHVTLTPGVKILYPNEFEQCTALTDLVIEDAADTISSGIDSYNHCGIFAACPIERAHVGRHIRSDKLPFAGCTTLDSLSLGSGVKTIPNSAFKGCTALRIVNFSGSSVEMIDNFAFQGCDSLQAVHISDLAAWCRISSYAFEDPPLLARTGHLYLNGTLVEGHLTIPDSVENIGDYAFYGYDKITSLTIPTGVQYVYANAFADCPNLSQVYIEDDSSPLYMDEFFTGSPIDTLYLGRGLGPDLSISSPTLRALTVGGEVREMWRAKFYSMPKLAAVHTPDLTAWLQITFTAERNNPLSTDSQPILYVQGKPVERLTVPGNISKIPDYAFASYAHLRTLTLSDGVEYVGDYAFRSTPLLEINFPHTLKGIGEYAFYNTSSPKITFPSSLYYMYDTSFLSCISLNELYFESSPYTLSVYHSSLYQRWGAFNNCHITKIYLGRNVRYTDGRTTFPELDELYQLTIGPEATKPIKEGDFASCNDLTLLTIEDGDKPLTYTGDQGFLNDADRNFTNVYIGRSIKGPLFRRTPDIGITFGPRIKKLQNYVFDGCTNFGRELELPDSLTTLGDGVFRDCPISVIHIPPTLKAIGREAFYQDAVSEVHITDLATWCQIDFADETSNPVYGRALYVNGERVPDLVIPDGVTSVNDYAFYNLGTYPITSVTLPPSVTRVGEHALECYTFESVHALSATPPAASATSFFDETYQNATLYVPQGAAPAYRAAEGWRLFAKIEETTATAIDGVPTTDGRITVKADRGILRLSAATDHTPVVVTDAAGRTVYRGVAPATIDSLPPGIYIVHTAGQTVKVVIR